MEVIFAVREHSSIGEKFFDPYTTVQIINQSGQLKARVEMVMSNQYVDAKPEYKIVIEKSEESSHEDIRNRASKILAHAQWPKNGVAERQTIC